MSITWGAAREAWAAEQHTAGLRPRTIEGRDALLRMLERSSGVGPYEVTKAHLVALLGRRNARTGLPLKPGTMQVERSYLQTFFAWMVEEGHREDDPARRLRKVKVPRRKPRPLHAVHIEAMLDSGAYRNTRDMITVAALTGLRVGEVVRIRGEDVDWASGTIRAIRKGGMDHRVPMSEAVREVAARRPARGWWFPSPYANAEFPNGGGHILMRSASNRISIVLRKSGVSDPVITAHSLRHFYATTLLRNGARLRVVQEMMGHASLNTTQLYAEVTDDDMAEAANVLPFIDARTHSGRARRLAA